MLRSATSKAGPPLKRLVSQPGEVGNRCGANRCGAETQRRAFWGRHWGHSTPVAVWRDRGVHDNLVSGQRGGPCNFENLAGRMMDRHMRQMERVVDEVVYRGGGGGRSWPRWTEWGEAGRAPRVCRAQPQTDVSTCIYSSDYTYTSLTWDGLKLDKVSIIFISATIKLRHHIYIVVVAA